MPALILEDVQGVTPVAQQEPYISIDTLRSRLDTAYETLRPLNVMTGEIKLDNILLTKDTVVFIDLELEEIVDCLKSWKLWRRSSIEQLCRYYNIWLKDDWIM